eukprot:Partr_v1_DN27937_c2_g1_i2_m11786 putative Presequence protease
MRLPFLCQTRRFASLEPEVKVGTVLHGYRVDSVRLLSCITDCLISRWQITPVAELQLTAICLSHLRTKAQHIHISRQDSNNVFSVAFKTTPWDSTGVPHILEHTVLCGSRKYPVRDPFFKMLNRSMATYMNAWTASDWTMYPFSATNAVDLENLRSVYMDATFHPLITRADFSQEGWRLEHQKVDDPKSPIVFKGVVYNEMKGAFSDTGSLFCQRMQQHLLPNCTYSFVSGGDPIDIPSLSHVQLVEFHRANYHPSNSRFFTYGDYPLHKHLEYIDRVLADFEYREPVRVKTLPDSFDGRRRVLSHCPPDPMGEPGKQTKMAVGFMINDSSDTYECFLMKILSSLLMSGHASPMHKALIQSNIGSEYAPGSGYDDGAQMATFAIGLQGIAEEDVDKVEAIIDNVFHEVLETGFDPARVEAIIHQIELGAKHRTASFGMGLAQGIVSTWIHDSDPIAGLQINANIERLRKDLEAPTMFQDRIRKYLIENNNRLTFVMTPAEDYNEKLVAAENDMLAKRLATLTDADKKFIYEDGLELAKLQDQVQDISCLPRLKVEDVPRKQHGFPLQFEKLESYPIQLRVSETNGITYFRGIATVNSIPVELRSALPLYCSALTSLGTTSKSSADFDNEIRLNTGGIGTGTFLSTSHDDIDSIQQGLIFSGNSLSSNTKLFDLLNESLHHTNFGAKKELKSLIMRLASHMMNSVAESGHGYARKLASSGLSSSNYYSEVYSGLHQVEWMNNLAKSENLAEIMSILEQISKHFEKNSELRLAITASQDSEMAKLSKFIEGTHFNPLSDDSSVFKRDLSAVREGSSSTWISAPFATNFTGQCLRTVPNNHKDVVPLRILASIVTHNFLHKEIREKNGAYGGGASYSSQDGLFSFYSYRDPNPLKSIETFGKAGEWLISADITQEKLDEAKLSLFSQLDSPVSASSEGMGYFQDRRTLEMTQQYRDRVFAATIDDVKRVAAEHLV